jgi:G3E family GTPase
MLTEDHDRRIAVIENEFGEIGIDAELLIRKTEEIVQVQNGCLCCTVRGDLIDALHGLLEMKDEFDHVVIETTGLADPGPVLQTLLLDPEITDQLELDGVVTVVDALHAPRHLVELAAVREQVAFADVIVVNKADLVGAADFSQVRTLLSGFNPIARVLNAQHADVPLDAVLDIGGFELNHPDLVASGSLAGAGEHHHDASIASIGIEIDGELNGPLLYRCIGDLLVTGGREIFRMKGIVAVAGSRHRLVLQGVHNVMDAFVGAPWGSAPRVSRMTLIGRQLDRETIDFAFRSCRAVTGSHQGPLRGQSDKIASATRARSS